MWPKTVLDVVVTDHLISSHPKLKALLCIFACLFGYSAGFPNLPFSHSLQTLWSFFPLLPGKLLWFLIHYTWSSVRVHLASCYLCLRNPCPDFAVSSCFFFFSFLTALLLIQPMVLDSCVLMRCFKPHTCAFTLHQTYFCRKGYMGCCQCIIHMLSLASALQPSLHSWYVI